MCSKVRIHCLETFCAIRAQGGYVCGWQQAAALVSCMSPCIHLDMTFRIFPPLGHFRVELLSQSGCHQCEEGPKTIKLKGKGVILAQLQRLPPKSPGCIGTLILRQAWVLRKECAMLTSQQQGNKEWEKRARTKDTFKVTPPAIHSLQLGLPSEQLIKLQTHKWTNALMKLTLSRHNRNHCTYFCLLLRYQEL